MRAFLFISFFTFFTCPIFAQPNPDPSDKNKSDSSQFFVFFDGMPVFKTAIYPDFGSFVTKNLKYPIDAKLNQIQGKVYVSYIIETDGSVSNVKIVEGKELYPSCDAEAVRVISSSPKWIPADQRVKMVQIISFKLQSK